jgi:hypothetical protein
VRLKLVTLALLVALVVAFGAAIAWAHSDNRFEDFNVYFIAADAFARGQDPYAISDAYPSPRWDALAHDLGITRFAKPYRYPPQTAVVLIALRPLGARAAAVVWAIANAIALIAAAWLIGRLLGGDWWVPASLAALLLYAPAFDTLLLGQVNGLILFSLALALWALRRRRDGLAGVSLAVGSVLKLVPFLLVVALAVRRRWRATAFAAGAIAVLTLACLPVIGTSGLADYARHALDLTRPNAVFTDQTNQSLSGVLGRALHRLHDPGAVRTAARVAGAVLLLATGWLVGRRGSYARWLLLECALVVTIMQLIFPFTWFHQFVLLLIPLLVVAQELVREGRRGRLAVLGALFVLTDLHFLFFSGLGSLSTHGVGYGWLDAFPFVFALTLWGMAARMLALGKRRARDRLCFRPAPD